MDVFSSDFEYAELRGKQVLIVEDDFFLASQMAKVVTRMGATVLGPVPSVEEALSIIGAHQVDAAILDVRLGDENSFPIAKTLRDQNIRTAFVTGFDDWYIPTEFVEVPVYRKPADPENILRVLFPEQKRLE